MRWKELEGYGGDTVGARWWEGGGVGNWAALTDEGREEAVHGDGIPQSEFTV